MRIGANHYDKTHVCKKSLDPEWNARFVFEVEEDEIQEEPLQIRYTITRRTLKKIKLEVYFINRVLDHDTYSSHDAIGKVYIDLKPLVTTNGPNSINGIFLLKFKFYFF